MSRDLVSVEYNGFVKVKNVEYKYDNGIYPVVYSDNSYYYVGRLGYVDRFLKNDCEFIM